MYYNRHTGHWNNEACQQSRKHNGGGSNHRCVKMDCHEATTHWSLLGIFKEALVDTFLESLLQYQGDCVWTDDEYKFMQAVGGTEDDGLPWPMQCTAVANNEDGLYYDIQPTAGGKMNVALYQDDRCSQVYTGKAISIDDVLIPTYASSLKEELNSFNSALDAFKICQPCKAYDLVSLIHKNQKSNANGDRYQHWNDDAENDDQEAQNNNNNGFVCSTSDHDINQCMMFRQSTKLQTASYRDILLAESQGTVTGILVGTVQLGEPAKKKHGWLSLILFLISLAVLVYGECGRRVQNHCFYLGVTWK